MRREIGTSDRLRFWISHGSVLNQSCFRYIQVRTASCSSSNCLGKGLDIDHLTIRVAWHDNKWNGAICRVPVKNSFCVALDRVYEERDDALEESMAEKSWDELFPAGMPPPLG